MRKKRKRTKLLFFPAWLSCRQTSFETFPFFSITGKMIQIPNIVWSALRNIFFSNTLARPNFQKGFWNILSLPENTIKRKPYGIDGMSETNTLLMEKVVLSTQLISPGLILSWYLNDRAHYVMWLVSTGYKGVEIFSILIDAQISNKTYLSSQLFCTTSKLNSVCFSKAISLKCIENNRESKAKHVNVFSVLNDNRANNYLLL